MKQSAPLLDAIHLLLETNQRGLPVVDDAGSLVGIISEVVKQMDINELSQVSVLPEEKLAGLIGHTRLLVELEQRLMRSTQALRR